MAGQKASIALEVDRLSLWYQQRMVYRDLSFSIQTGEIVSLLGPSGSGKSSLLLALAQLLPKGARLETSQKQLPNPKKIGMVFQRALAFPMSVFENVALALRERGIREPGPIVINALVAAGLWEEVKDRLHEPAHKLSGGQLQRLCLARTLALGPEILLLDEPCASLDPLSTKTIEDTLRQLKQSKAIMIVTHNLAQAQRLSDRCLVLWPGPEGASLVEVGSLADRWGPELPKPIGDYLSGVIG